MRCQYNSRYLQVAVAASAKEENLPADATTSIGLATFLEGGSSPDDLLHLADRTLYRANENVRDQVCALEKRDALTGLLNRFDVTDLLR